MTVETRTRPGWWRAGYRKEAGTPAAPRKTRLVAWKPSARAPLVAWAEVQGGRHLLTVTAVAAGGFTARWIDRSGPDGGAAETGFSSIAGAQNWLERRIVGLPVRHRKRRRHAGDTR